MVDETLSFFAANSKKITACVVLVLDRNPVHPLSASAPLCSGGVLEENLNNFHISQTLPLPPNQGSLQHHVLTIYKNNKQSNYC